MLSDHNARVAAARKLTDARARRQAGRFLAEGAPAVREALRRPGTVVQLFATAESADRHPDLLALARSAGLAVDEVSPAAARALSETVAAQGLVAVCRRVDVALDAVLTPSARLVAALIETNDPGNAGTAVRAADAAGASAVVITRPGVDVHNGKAVRASAGSIFHLDVVTDAEPQQVLRGARAAGLQVFATSGAGDEDLDDLADSGALRTPTLWLFGNEVRGLDAELLEAADRRVRVPIYGRAESLNLAIAAAVCLYTSARAQRAARP
ncbi:MAG: RNA methyltransferase [Actinomycetota bacterium]|nr:RNA methyltransferase [Actinomycetota bacterium]